LAGKPDHSTASLAAECQWAADQKTSEKEDRITIEFTSMQYYKVLR
jgi:hypothetical protein